MDLHLIICEECKKLLLFDCGQSLRLKRRSHRWSFMCRHVADNTKDFYPAAKDKNILVFQILEDTTQDGGGGNGSLRSRAR